MVNLSEKAKAALSVLEVASIKGVKIETDGFSLVVTWPGQRRPETLLHHIEGHREGLVELLVKRELDKPRKLPDGSVYVCTLPDKTENVLISKGRIYARTPKAVYGLDEHTGKFLFLCQADVEQPPSSRYH